MIKVSENPDEYVVCDGHPFSGRKSVFHIDINRNVKHLCQECMEDLAAKIEQTLTAQQQMKHEAETEKRKGI